MIQVLGQSRMSRLKLIMQISRSKMTCNICVKIKMDDPCLGFSMSGQILTVEDILGQYFYKERIQDYLRAMGLGVTGGKAELICRLIGAISKSGETVSSFALELVNSLDLADLRSMTRLLGLDSRGKKGDLISRIETTKFEPYTETLLRHCEMCGKETLHEVHFDDNWRKENFVCPICETSSYLSISSTPDVDKTRTKSNIVLEDRTAAGTIIGTGISVFLACVFGLDTTYGIVLSFVLSVTFAMTSIITLALTKSYWERNLIFLTKNRAR